jgi:hypothetical protein
LGSPSGGTSFVSIADNSISGSTFGSGNLK